jgi:hypothetical protein
MRARGEHVRQIFMALLLPFQVIFCIQTGTLPAPRWTKLQVAIIYIDMLEIWFYKIRR